jgi:membrane-bound lytic murein transglycosylase D
MLMNEVIPLKSTAAAAKYMSNMYLFLETGMVLASYNSGPGNVSKNQALRRKTKLLGHQKHLPKETQDMFLHFSTTMYLYEYHNEHGIKADRAVVQHFATDTIMIKSKCHLNKLRTC